MDATQSLMLAAAAVLGGALVWGFAHWWFGRRLRGAAARVDKLEHARQLLNQQVSQARRQVEQLQKELAETRLTEAARVGASRAKAARSVEVPPPAPPEEAEPPQLPKDGFAPTQVMRRKA